MKRHLSNSEGGLHESYGNWAGFLSNSEPRVEHAGCKLYNPYFTNCWYTVDAEGYVYESFGYNCLSSFCHISGMKFDDLVYVLGW